MNILMALSQLEVTGAEVYGTLLSDELIKRGNKVWIVSDTLTKETKANYTKIEFNKRSIFRRVGQVRKLLKIIKENDIQVVHAHSRASSWSCRVACKIAKIPLITTAHGRQPVHLSRKIFKGFGDRVIAICENVKSHLIEELGVKSNSITLIRNMVDETQYRKRPVLKNILERKTISLIGRLSGPKGEVAYKILEHLYPREEFYIQVIGGKEIPKEFEKFSDRVNFIGYSEDVSRLISESDLVLGAGRIAVEALLSEIPVIAIGEAEFTGVVTLENIDKALASNFGDILERDRVNFQWEKFESELDKALNMNSKELSKLREITIEQFSLEKIVEEIEKIYQREIVKKRKWEMPILMYHRIINEKDEKGVHRNYITVKNFEKHLKYLKKMGYKTVTFEDLKDNNYKNRFAKGNKWIMLTFDDGYKDNYENAFPLLKKYGYKGTIYAMDGLTYNKWDTDDPENPEKKFPLLNRDEILEMKEYGIEFGGHTVTHPRLTEIGLSSAKAEIENSKYNLGKLLNKELTSFAYPYGNLNSDVKELAKKAGYEFAVATDSGTAVFSDDLHQIRRIALFSTNNMFNFKRKVTGRYNFSKIKQED